MKLTDKQKQLVANKLRILQGCPVCHGHQLTMSDTLFEVREFNEGNLIIGGNSAVYPLLAISCNDCGHTLFFNAILLGVLSKNTKQSESENGKK